MSGQSWQLVNEQPRRRATEVPLARERQRALFCGLDCLPGQRDLFATDGEAADASIERATALGVGNHDWSETG